MDTGTRATNRQVVTIPYEQLCSPQAELSEAIHQAYSSQGLGILTVSNVPGLLELRGQLLRSASQFAALPQHVKAKYEDPCSNYNLGWSHGQEAMASGQPDTHKGSYYANPVEDDPAHGDEHLAQQHPEYFRPNIWPSADLPSLEPSFKALGRLVHDVGMLLAQHCDRYVSQQNASMQPGKLVQVLRGSRHHKGRLLHYFPHQPAPGSPVKAGSSSEQADAWCGWHTDHGSLTGLTAAMYIDEATGQQVACPDPSAGLHIRNRQGEVVQVAIPPDHIAFQVGEAMQVHSGGVLRATPHFVRGARGPAAAGISRNTFALFMQPDVTADMEAPAGASDVEVAVGQWRPGQTFGTFASETFKKYYGHAFM